MIITISGKPGSGKSTLAKMLAEKLDFKHYYMGALRRAMAKKRGMTLRELNTIGEKEAWTDTEVDEYQKKLGQTEDDFIIEGRTSFLFIPNSLKIFIDVSPRVGAERVFHDVQKKDNERNEDSNLSSVEAVQESHERRIASDQKRYQQYYHVDVYDTAHYDLVLDTSVLNPEQSFERLDAFVSQHLTQETTGGRG